MFRDAFRCAGAAVGCLVAACFLLIAGCSGTGGFRVVPEPLRPELGRFFTRTIIRGRCYLTDGIYCLPCDGGPPMDCAQLLLLDLGPSTLVTPLDRNVGPPAPPPQTDTPPRSPTRFAQLTGGLDGPAWATIAGLAEWEPGDAVELPFHATLDADADMLEVSFLWWSAWERPVGGDLPAGVQAHFYASGDFTDEEPDLMLITLSGPASDVKKAMSILGDPEITWFRPEDGG